MWFSDQTEELKVCTFHNLKIKEVSTDMNLALISEIHDYHTAVSHFKVEIVSFYLISIIIQAIIELYSFFLTHPESYFNSLIS